MLNIPILTLELREMRHTIHHMLSDRMTGINDAIQAQVDATLDPANVKRIVEEVVSREIDAQLKESVRHYYSYGKGAEALRAGVTEALDSLPPEKITERVKRLLNLS